ncbi:MAG: hypothetical protein PSX80_01620 [bacterium]|nr:hypothetical protein [bacterium]
MNVFHKVLVKIFEITGGKDNVEVDLVDLLKKEGFFPSIDSISAQLLGESWITDGGRKYTCKITHWGVAEAKRVMSNAPDKVSEVEKESKRLLTEARGLITMLEEFASKPDSKKFDGIEKRISDLADRSKAVRQHL